MDAPPAQESCDAFIAIADLFTQSPVRFPVIHAKDVTQGFLLLTDFGDQQLLSLLSAQSADHWYSRAIETLLAMQLHHAARADSVLPTFDYWREFEIFLEWYLQKNQRRILSSADLGVLRHAYQLLIDEAFHQPQVFVHRDYHSRNLMVCDDQELGILDFQDAVQGPLTYDLVSLLRDCYIDWPVEKIQQWARFYYDQANAAVDWDTFLRWFDWTGLQRHLKCLGIFSRLSLRDQKHRYLSDIPRVLQYARTVCDRYPALQTLRAYL